MAWSTLPTYTSGSVLTAAQMNAIAANINETSAATVTTAGDMTYADAANSMGNRLAIGAAGSHLVSSGSAPVWRTITGGTGNTSYSGGDSTYKTLNNVIWGSGTAISATVTTGTSALVNLTTRYVSNSSAGQDVSITYEVSGATTIASGDSRGGNFESGAANDRGQISVTIHETALTAGSNKFEFTAKVSGGTGTIAYPRITVIPTR